VEGIAGRLQLGRARPEQLDHRQGRAHHLQRVGVGEQVNSCSVEREEREHHDGG
jgi:hypothetical protein